MDDSTCQALRNLGIDPQTVPEGEVRLVNGLQIQANLGQKAAEWARDLANTPALAYRVETEHNRKAGVVLRNLHQGPQRAHLTVTAGPGPHWHNLHVALPDIYKTGLAVIVEGPKDARALWANGVAVIAYLGPAPGKGHLKTIRRYAGTVVWLPDNDQAPDPDVEEKDDPKERKIQRVQRAAEEIGINLMTPKYSAKDPAELAKDPIQLAKLLGKIDEIRALAS